MRGIHGARAAAAALGPALRPRSRLLVRRAPGRPAAGRLARSRASGESGRRRRAALAVIFHEVRRIGVAGGGRARRRARLRPRCRSGCRRRPPGSTRRSCSAIWPCSPACRGCRCRGPGLRRWRRRLPSPAGPTSSPSPWWPCRPSCARVVSPARAPAVDRPQHRRGRGPGRRAVRAASPCMRGAAVQRRRDGAAVLRLAGAEPVRAAAARSADAAAGGGAGRPVVTAALALAALGRRSIRGRQPRCWPLAASPPRSASWRWRRPWSLAALPVLAGSGPPAGADGARRPRGRRSGFWIVALTTAGLPVGEAVTRAFAHRRRLSARHVRAPGARDRRSSSRPRWPGCWRDRPVLGGALDGAAAGAARALDRLGAVVRRHRVGHHRALPAAAGDLHAVRAGRRR